MGDITYKTYQVQTRQVGDDPLTYEAVISTGAVDRDGEIVMPEGVDIANYLRNPVVLFAHRYHEPPVAKAEAVWREDNAIVARFRFPDEGTYDFADTVRRLWSSGFLNAVSVGFIPRERDGNVITKWELLEFSIVPVPANQEALRRIFAPGRMAADKEPEEPEAKGVIPYKRTPLAPEDAQWDAAAERAKADVDDLKVMCAWYDAENPDIKSSYKLPHHRADPPECVWRAVAAAMAALMGARGGVQIPDDDVPGVYRHLARHYEDFDKEPPKLDMVWEERAKLCADDAEPTADDTEPITTDEVSAEQPPDDGVGLPDGAVILPDEVVEALEDVIRALGEVLGE